MIKNSQRKEEILNLRKLIPAIPDLLIRTRNLDRDHRVQRVCKIRIQKISIFHHLEQGNQKRKNYKQDYLGIKKWENIRLRRYLHRLVGLHFWIRRKEVDQGRIIKMMIVWRELHFRAIRQTKKKMLHLRLRRNWRIYKTRSLIKD